MDAQKFTEQLKRQAEQLGFSRCGIVPAVEPHGYTHLLEWLDAGYAGEMHYLESRRNAYAHPSSVLSGVRSLVVMAFPYSATARTATAAGQGRVARYAWGTVDYHELLHDRMHQLIDWFNDQIPTAVLRGVVDSAPLLEREFAQLAGLGWIGKNTLLLNKFAGSYFFLATLLTDYDLPADRPHLTAHCGTCRACLDACPTGAFPQPGVLDARRCISYLTIEHRGPIPTDLRKGIGDWFFGCDICQEVCPWNRRVTQEVDASLAPQPWSDPVDLVELFFLDETSLRQRYRKTPLWRAKRRGLLRNAAIVLGNQASPTALAALVHGLNDKEPLVRGASAWALGQLELDAARDALQQRQAIETDSTVQSELAAALRLYSMLGS